MHLRVEREEVSFKAQAEEGQGIVRVRLSMDSRSRIHIAAMATVLVELYVIMAVAKLVQYDSRCTT
jgi:hypothetical protein